MKWWQKLCYGAGDFGSNYALTFVTSFALIYMTDAVGLNAGILGTLIMISKCLDGVTDVLFGTLMDRTNSKMGKARPWMFWSTFPLAVSEIMLFMVPQASATLQYVYFFVVYTLLNAFFYTANNIAYSSLTALVTKNPNERVQMGSIRYMFAAAADFWRNMKLLVKNRYCMLILAYYILYYLSSGINGGVGVYFCKYVLGNASLLGLFTMATMIPAIIGLIITPFVVKKFGIYNVNSKGMIVSAIFAGLFAFAGYQGNFTLMLVFLAIREIFASPMMGTLNAVISEASHYTYLKEGVHLDGTMFSCSSMGMKVGGGLGSAVCGWLLALGGYDGLAEVQTAGAISMITFMYLLMPLIISTLNAIVVFFLNVSKANRELEAGK